MLYMYKHATPTSVLKCYILVVQRLIDKSSHQRLSEKNVFLQIPQDLQENTCPRVSSFRDSKKLRCLPVNFP